MSSHTCRSYEYLRRRLEKALRQIADLQGRAALDAAQADKVRREPTLVDELAASALLLNRGAAFVRLRSSLDEACKCEGLKRVDWSSAAFSRGNNWWALHCPGGDDAPPSNAETCLESHGAAAARAGGFDPLRFRCFTSEDSAWSLDAVLVDRNRTLREPWQFPSPYAWGAFREPTTLAAYAARKSGGEGKRGDRGGPSVVTKNMHQTS